MIAGLLALAAALVGGAACLVMLEAGPAALGFWVVVAAEVALFWLGLETLAKIDKPRWIGALVVPGVFGVLLLWLWQVLTVGFDVPPVLLPSPARIGHQLAANPVVLWQDFRQTFLKSVLAGFTLGSAAGFLVAVLVDRSPFLQRGLLPLGSLVSAIPIVGVAPIMVMWFGFDWQSKAAVIVVMTFFPMLINTLAGFAASDPMSRDLMRSYGASYWQTFFKLRLPGALPFVFNALKINSTLALIGAIVSEFFGSPISGLGFRISVEIGRMNVDVVWATIAVAALAGSLFYGVLALLERLLTFWHPSYRR
jgi:NitT/TauT family transport system permease protein